MPASVVVLEDDDDLRETIAQLVGLVGGADCVAARSVVELKSREAQALSSRLAILDINLGAGQPSGIDACQWLRERGFAGRIVFLTGHGGNHPLVEEARRINDAVVWTKPMSYQQIAQLVGEAAE